MDVDIHLWAKPIECLDCNKILSGALSFATQDCGFIGVAHVCEDCMGKYPNTQALSDRLGFASHRSLNEKLKSNTRG